MKVTRFIAVLIIVLIAGGPLSAVTTLAAQ